MAVRMAVRIFSYIQINGNANVTVSMVLQTWFDGLTSELTGSISELV